MVVVSKVWRRQMMYLSVLLSLLANTSNKHCGIVSASCGWNHQWKTTTTAFASRWIATARTTRTPRPLSGLRQTPNDDNDDDEADYEDFQTGDWRTFRMTLSEKGIADTPDASVLFSEDEGEEVTTTSRPLVGRQRPKSVSKKNEELLQRQSEELAQEYRQGIWAHETTNPEVGGLLCRLPLEAEIFKSATDSAIGRELQSQLQDISLGGESGAQTALWYRTAQRLIQEQMQAILELSPQGMVDPATLTAQAMEFLQMYMDNQETWQQVALVLDMDEKTGEATTVVINRPLAFEMSESLGRLLLYGSAQDSLVAVNDAQSSDSDNNDEDPDLVRLLVAFGTSQCGIYLGGPNGMDEPATLVHGLGHLEGAAEVSPGTGIYTGGLDAAISAVLAGQAKPLDFRFFVGKSRHVHYELGAAVRQSKYQPVACNRALALKQCIALPKPLWHEVMELCGGELKELSAVELSKRTDLKPDEE